MRLPWCKRKPLRWLFIHTHNNKSSDGCAEIKVILARGIAQVKIIKVHKSLFKHDRQKRGWWHYHYRVDRTELSGGGGEGGFPVGTAPPCYSDTSPTLSGGGGEGGFPVGTAPPCYSDTSPTLTTHTVGIRLSLGKECSPQIRGKTIKYSRHTNK